MTERSVNGLTNFEVFFPGMLYDKILWAYCWLDFITSYLFNFICFLCYSVTNIFLVNLSAADLLVTSICMPIQLSKAITLVWFYGDTVCKIVNYIQGKFYINFLNFSQSSDELFNAGIINSWKFILRIQHVLGISISELIHFITLKIFI